MTLLGPRVQENNYDMYQLAVGVRGRLPGDWVVDAYVQYGASSQWKYQTGGISRSRVDELTFAPDGGAAICGGFDIFGLDSVEPRCAAYVARERRHQRRRPANSRRGLGPRRSARAARG